MSPADKVIAAFGGVRAAARALGLNPSSVSRWRVAKERGGLDGRVPSTQQRRILDVSSSQSLGLVAADLIHDK